MKLGAPRFFRRSVLLAAAGILAVVLTACTGRGGGQLPPDKRARVHRPGVVRLQLQLRGQGRPESADRSARIQLAYTDQGTSPIGSSFAIHGIVDKIDPVLESAICIGQNPPPPPGTS